MALINCPECGKEISDTCDACIHCGYKLSDNTSSKDKKTNKKKVPIVAILLVIVIIIGIGIASILIISSIRENNRIEQEKQEQLLEQEEKEAKKLIYEEEICYYAIQYFKTILKNPDSLQINNIKISPSLYACNDGKDSDGHYATYAVVLDYSAQNSLGGYNREEYYIIMNGNSISEDAFEDQIQLQFYYVDDMSCMINIDKIKYALNHPEVLDY